MRIQEKIYFCLKEKNISLNKKAIFLFHTIFKLDFITQIIYGIIHRCLYSFFSSLYSLLNSVLLYQFLRKGT